MRKVACLAGAATIALASLFGASAASANPYHHNWHNGAIGFGVAGLAAGALLGTALADAPPPPPPVRYYAPPPPPAPVYVYRPAPPIYEEQPVYETVPVYEEQPVYRVISPPSHTWAAHVRACERAYDSYDPHSNTYIAPNGRVLTCHV